MFVALSHLIIEIALCGGGEECTERIEHRDDTAYQIVDTVVLDPQLLQDHTGRVKRHNNQHKHAYIHECRVLCQSFSCRLIHRYFPYFSQAS